MTLQLSAQSEKLVPYQYFGDGRVVDLMPQLRKAGYNPAGVSVLVDRRQNAPEEVRANFNTYFWTGDSAGTDEKGGALLTVDSPLLRQLTPESSLVNGALKLEPKQWKELKADKEHSLYLTPTQVEDAYGKGYVLEEGIWGPANKTVGNVWEGTNTFPGLARGRSLQTYAQMVSEASKSNDIMRLYFDRSKQSTPTLRSLVLDRIGDYSLVNGDDNLDNNNGRLVGVAPEAHVAREKSDSQRIVQPTLEQTLAVINNPDLNRDGMVKAVSQLYK